MNYREQKKYARIHRYKPYVHYPLELKSADYAVKKNDATLICTGLKGGKKVYLWLVYREDVGFGAWMTEANQKPKTALWARTKQLALDYITFLLFVENVSNVTGGEA